MILPGLPRFKPRCAPGQDPDDLRKTAKTAAIQFHKSHNLPGELRAQYLLAYADQRAQDGKACLAKMAGIEDRIRARKYSGLLAQLLIDKAICENRAGHPGEIKIMAEALKTAADSHYEVIGLRVLGIESGLKKEAHNCQAAWARSSQGLKVYWQGKYPIERLAQLYQPLSECAEFQGFWHTAYEIRTHAIEMQEVIDQRDGHKSSQLAALYLDLANILVALKREELATEAVKKSRLIFKTDSPTDTKFRVSILTRLAELQLENGRPDAAFATLESDLGFFDSIDDAALAMRGNAVLGDIYHVKGKLESSAQAYQKGIQVRGVAGTLPGSKKDWIGFLPLIGYTAASTRSGLNRVEEKTPGSCGNGTRAAPSRASHQEQVDSVELAGPFSNKKWSLAYSQLSSIRGCPMPCSTMESSLDDRNSKSLPNGYRVEKKKSSRKRCTF